jgi:hypothetical protein
MKKIILSIVSIFAILTLLSSPLQASSVKGKIFYAKTLKSPCGFTGELMGKKHTVAEWRDIYNANKMNDVIKGFCPKAPLITEEKDLTNLYHFLSSFASDSGNVPSCN